MTDPTEWIRGKLEEDPKVRAVAEQSREIAVLREQPGWQTLIRRLEKEKEEWLLDIAERLFNGKQEVPTEEIRFMAGFYRGAEYVLRHPEVAEDSFVAAARVAWAMYEQQAAAESTNQEGSTHA